MADTLLEAIASGEMTRIIAVVDPAFKAAAKEASARVQKRGRPAVDGRAGEPRSKVP